MIAALFVDPHGIYSTIDGVECWGLPDRDAREYAGPHPVVAHPPCSRWCRLAGLVEKRWGHIRGEDGGCFAAALAVLRRFGGVLEHPAYSDAWSAHDLAPPISSRSCEWIQNMLRPREWTCHVDQYAYGHAAIKSTWLLYVGDRPPARARARARARALVSWCGNHTRIDDDRPRLGKKAASATPLEFAEFLVSLARGSVAA